MGRNIEDLVGKKFGRLTVLKFAGRDNGNVSCWHVTCDCGNKKIVRNGSLKNGGTKSCGCLKKEATRKRLFKHGVGKTKFYYIWNGMKTRCLNKNDKRFKDYGGRGIKICDRWLKFENFRDDMLESYEKHIKEFGEKRTQIDRINNDGNYEKENCKFATCEEQANNRRTNHILEFNGEKLNMKQWAKKLGINNTTLCERINTLGWSTERALTKKEL